MANFSSLKQAIQNYIKENGNKEITGNLLQEILLSMVVTMGDNAINSLTTVVNELNTILHSVDAEPTKNSVNLVRSGGVWSGINREALRAFNAETFEARFNSTNNRVEFFNQSGDMLYWYDASAFVTTGLVEDVYIENDNLVFVINTSAGEKTIEVPLEDVFNPNNYYTKTQIDDIVRTIRELYDGAEYRGFITPSSQAESKQGVKMVCFATEAGTYTNFLANYDTPIVIPVRGIWVFERGVDADDWTAYSLLEIDKVYAPAQASGMGRVVLQKNMVNGVNTLTQDMFYKGEVGSRVPNTNTIFVIEYDFILGEDITVPANCVLEFDGGSISGNNIIDFSNLLNDKIYVSWMANNTLLASIHTMSNHTLVIDKDLELNAPISNIGKNYLQSFRIIGSQNNITGNQSTKAVINCNGCRAIDLFGYVFEIENILFQIDSNSTAPDCFIRLQTSSVDNSDLDSEIKNCSFSNQTSTYFSTIISFGRGLKVKDCSFSNTPSDGIVKCYMRSNGNTDPNNLNQWDKYSGRAFVFENNRLHTAGIFVRLDINNLEGESATSANCVFRGVRIIGNLSDNGGSLCYFDAPSVDTLITNNTFVSSYNVHYPFFTMYDACRLSVTNNVFTSYDTADRPAYISKDFHPVLRKRSLTQIENISFIGNIISVGDYALFVEKCKGLIFCNNTFTKDSFSSGTNSVVRTIQDLQLCEICGNQNISNYDVFGIFAGNASNITLSDIIIKNNVGVKSLIKPNGNYSSWSVSNLYLDILDYAALDSDLKSINIKNLVQFFDGNALYFVNGSVARRSDGRRFTTPMAGDSESGFPYNQSDYGQYIYDTVVHKPIWLTDIGKLDALGFTRASKYGYTNQRPTTLIRGDIGYLFFDISLNKPIWYAGKDGNNQDIWVDATGTPV